MAFFGLIEAVFTLNFLVILTWLQRERFSGTMAEQRDYQRISEVLHYIDDHEGKQPTLDELSELVHLSPFHFQRLFKRWVGLPPKRFMQCLAVNRARQAMDQTPSLEQATLKPGLSSVSRLHDLFVTIHAVTPAQDRADGLGLTIRYGFHSTPFGECLVGSTDRGVCWLSFIETRGDDNLSPLKKEWPAARLIRDGAATSRRVTDLFSPLSDEVGSPIHLLVKGTNFQVKVWEALLRIPEGSVASYRQIAVATGKETAVRAVGNAVGANPISYLIPCHRVVRSTGAIGNYRWGSRRKSAMLAWEGARRSAAEEDRATKAH
jgi:AraC family transcriptional regulator of adaptative response/methylated-DNA-[protein]-cysteine methyltransferase